MEEIGVTEQLLLAPHNGFAALGYRVQHSIPHFVRQLFGPLLDNGVARVGILVDRVTEAHDLFFTLQHAQQACFGFVRGLELLDQRHGGFVGTAVQRASQGADGAGYTAVDVGQRGGAHTSRKGRGIEFVLGVEDQRHVHYTLVQFTGLLAVEQLQEVPADGIDIAVGFNAHALVGEAVPVSNDRREDRQHAVDLVVLLAEVLFGFQVAQHGAAGAHHVHRVRVLGYLLQHGFQGSRQAPQALELCLVGSQLLAVR